MRNSKQRNAIIEILQNSKEHMTADRVYDEARKILPNISLGTVYRNLGQLTNHHILKTIYMNGIVHYDAFLDNHQHFFCRSCNKVYDVEVDTKEFVSIIDTKINHKIDNCQVQLFGICEKCQNN